ncbi:aminoglycoside phosphotransferase family protein [Kitasatospora saccharophila]|uniref:Aminoglycoside phosphotransferase family protein n=2 Tax=Kitasatospora saccharophila TaxID=407973 RepID=A0ABP5I0Y6_9ACTN
MLHEDEVPGDEALVRALVAEQCPQWGGLPVVAAGAGTDNTMYRVGGGLLVRLPRTADAARAARKEREWLPRLAPSLSWPVPEPLYAGVPGAGFPLVWSVYRWLEGAEAGPDSVRDWAGFGADLAQFVRELHGADLRGARRTGELSWYRGGGLRAVEESIAGRFGECRALLGGELDLDALEGLWRDGLALPEPSGPHGWLHGDLKPSNLLVRDGRLSAVIDFGCLSVGHPDAEHAPVWDLPPEARRAYREALAPDEATWTRARAWAIAVAVSGIPYYWRTLPAFAAECLARLRAVLDEVAGPEADAAAAAWPWPPRA